MRRRVEKQRKTNQKKVIVVALILLLAVSFVVLTQTKLFDVKKIVVEGNREVSEEKIITTSGIVIGENIFKIDKKEAKENILLHPYIKNARIKRKLPDQIIINLTEREEVAYVKHLDSYVYIGFDGLVLDISKLEKKNKVPMLKGLSIENPSIGSKIIYKKKNEKQTDQIMNFLETSAKKGVKKQTKIVKFNDKNINLVLNKGVNVAFGPPTNIEYKITFLINVLDDLKRKKIDAANIYLNKGNDIIVEVVESLGENDEKDQ